MRLAGPATAPPKEAPTRTPTTPKPSGPPKTIPVRPASPDRKPAQVPEPKPGRCHPFC